MTALRVPEPTPDDFVVTNVIRMMPDETCQVDAALSYHGFTLMGRQFRATVREFRKNGADCSACILIEVMRLDGRGFIEVRRSVEEKANPGRYAQLGKMLVKELGLKIPVRDKTFDEKEEQLLRGADDNIQP